MNYCSTQLENALLLLRDFEKTKDTLIFKGYITTHRVKRIVNGNIKYYTYKIFEVVNYVDGKREKIRKSISTNQIDNLQAKLSQKRENKVTFTKLKKSVLFWKTQLNRFIKKGIFNLNLFLDIEKHKHSSNINKDKQFYRIKTINNENVRSKNECIYANISYFLCLPYYYEKDLSIKIFDYDYREFHYETLHPDFTHIINGKFIYVELLGMMDNPQYNKKWETRLREYKDNGIIIGKNLICIHCRSGQDLDSQVIHNLMINLKEGIIPEQIIYA